MDPVEIVKKHANDWKFLTLNGVTAEEMRAIRANLPQFARNQFRQVIHSIWSYHHANLFK